MGEGRGAPLVAVVIPALNEAATIERVVRAIPDDGRFEAIVIDDGSSDGTAAAAERAGAALVIRRPTRGGVGAAIRDGWTAGANRGRPYVALVSGDAQHEPSELAPALDALLASKADYLQGSRWVEGGRVVGRSSGRIIGTKAYSVAFSMLVGRRVTDATNGFRIFRSELLAHPEVRLDQPWLDSYELEPYVLYKAIRLGYRVVEHPVTVRYPEVDRYSHMDGFRDWWRLFRPAVLLRARVRR